MTTDSGRQEPDFGHQDLDSAGDISPAQSRTTARGAGQGTERETAHRGAGRPTIAGAHRIVVKIGSSSLTTPTGGIDPGRIQELVDTLAVARAAGREVVLVSSGAIAAGLSPLGLKTRPRDLATQQAAASVGQGLLMGYYTHLFAAHGLEVGQVLLTVDDVTRRGHYRNAYRTFGRLLELGVMPIVNENDTVATHEIRFGDNDRLAALVAHLVHADALILLSDVDALYTGHPKLPESAARSPTCTRDEDLARDRHLDPRHRGRHRRHDHQGRCRQIATVGRDPDRADLGRAGRGLPSTVEPVGTALPPDRQAPTHPAALAAARLRRPRRAGAGRRRRPGGGHPQRLSAARRGDGGPRAVHRRRGRRPGRSARAGRGPRVGQLRRR